MNCKWFILAFVLCFFCTNSVLAQDNWVFGNAVQSSYNYNPSGQTIQYYPPELGSGSSLKYNRTTPYFYQVPSRIEPNVQPNPLKDELEKTNYV